MVDLARHLDPRQDDPGGAPRHRRLLTLSVVIVAFGSREALARCLASLAGMDVVVVDNGGDAVVPDGVRLVSPGRNLGFAGGCNLGAREARGDVLLFLNPDTVVAEGALDRLARTLEDEAIGIAMPRLLLLDRPETLNSRGTIVHVTGLAWAGGYGEPADSVGELEDVPAPSGAALAIRRELFEELGGFTDELFMYLEDVELGWRAHLHGLRVVVDPGADVLHEYEFARNRDKLALLERNRLVFVLSAYSLRLLLLLTPVLIAFELAAVLTAARGGWMRGKLGGWWWCARRPRWLLQHRRETQRLRRLPDRDLAAYLTPELDPRMLPLPPGIRLANRLCGAYWKLARSAL
ncbi:MAG: glycosyltransferase family 2 protein [Gaiellaceae bacterium]